MRVIAGQASPLLTVIIETPQFFISGMSLCAMLDFSWIPVRILTVKGTSRTYRKKSPCCHSAFNRTAHVVQPDAFKIGHKSNKILITALLPWNSFHWTHKSCFPLGKKACLRNPFLWQFVQIFWYDSSSHSPRPDEGKKVNICQGFSC